VSFGLYRLYLILDISHSISPAESDRQDEYHLLNLVWISDMCVFLSESTSFQATEHGFDFPTPSIHPQRILEFEVGNYDHLFLGAFSFFDRNVERKTPEVNGVIHNFFPREPLPQASYWKFAVLSNFYHGILFDPDDEWDLLFDQKTEPLRSYELAIREKHLNSADPESFYDPL
jgi:hypothetical protein